MLVATATMAVSNIVVLLETRGRAWDRDTEGMSVLTELESGDAPLPEPGERPRRAVGVGDAELGPGAGGGGWSRSCRRRSVPSPRT